MTSHAIVTGGSSGIGAATAVLLARSGYTVTALGRDEARLAEVADTAPGIRPLVADLSTPAGARAAVVEAAERAGRLDVLVNAHGILGEPTPLEDLSDDQWDFVLATNLRGPIATTTAAIPYLKTTRGSVVNVSSINAIQAEPWMAPYGVSKAAISGFTKYAAADLAPYGIRVNAVLPGWVRTPMAVGFFEEAGVLDAPMDTNFQQRAAEPSELAAVIAFLASPQASYVTGECLVADGGHWINMRALAPVSSTEQ